MKASDLIQVLADLISEHGDADIAIDTEGLLYDARTVDATFAYRYEDSAFWFEEELPSEIDQQKSI